MKPLYAILLLAGMGMSGCDDPHDNAPVQSTSFVIPKDGVMGTVGGGGGFTGTHWERYVDARNDHSIVCLYANQTGGGTSAMGSCVDEGPTKDAK